MNSRLILLRAMLVVVGLAGLFSGIALFIPWTSTVRVLNRLKIEGVPSVISAPIIEYWLLQMAAVAAVIGIACLTAAVNPRRHRGPVTLLGWGLVLVGVASGYHGFRLGLAPWPFYADLAICGVCGPGIIWLSGRV